MRSSRFSMVSACCLLSVAAAVAQGLDPGKRISQYAAEHWDDEDGLPSVYVYDAAQTPDGYLWLATGDGLVRFDGVRFTVFNSLNTPALTTDDVFALDAGSEGRLWIGTSDGSVVVRAGPRMDRLVEPDPQTEDGVMAIHEDRRGDLWVWRDLGGLARYRTSGAGLVDAGLPPELAAVSLPPQQIPRRSIYEDRAGRLWLASQGGGLYGLAADGLRHLTTAGGLSGDFVHTVAEDADGSLWIGSDGGLDRYRDGEVTAMTSALGLAGGTVTALAADRAGSLWIGKRHVYRWAGGRLERLESTGEIRGDLCLREDDEGSLWIGTAEGDLFRLRDDGITPLGPPEGFPDTIVLSMIEDRAGRMWLGTLRAGLVVLDGAETTPVRWTAITTADGLPHDRIWSIHHAGDEELWLGTDGGLVRLSGGLPPGGVVRVFTTADGLSDDRVRVVYEDPQEPGTLWLGTIGGGVSRLRDGVFRRWTTADGLANVNVRWLHKDRAGALWIGLQNGLQRLPAADGELETFTRDDGLASTRMRAVYEDADGTLWVGTSGGGLSRYRDGRFVSYTRKDGLVCDDVWGILEDDEGSFWLTGECASRVARRDFEAYDAGRIPRLGAEEVAAPAFERTTCCTAGGFPAGWKSRDGRLWLPGAPGLVVVDPRRQRGPQELPPPVVESITVDGEATPVSGALTIRPGAENLEIRYTCPSLPAARRLELRYRLEGFDEGWVAAGSRRVAYYSRLPPGRYEFQVTVRAGPGPWRREAAAIPLRLLPLWWQTLWFRGAALLAVIGSAAAWHRWRTRKIDERRRRLQREVDERRRAEQALRAEVAERERAQEALREHREQLAHVGRVTTMGELAAALAHELNQPLTAIGTNARAAQRFLAGPEPDLEEIREILDDVVADNRRAAEVIRRLRALMKKEELRLEQVDVNEAAGEVIELLRSEAVIHGVALETRLGSGLPPVEADRVHLWQVLVNLIFNAIEAMGETPAGERRVVVGTERADGGEVRVTVRDSGAGFGGQEAAALFAPFHSTKTEGLGMGLAISKSIIEAHGGRIRAAENPDCGVTFQFTLPAA